MHQHPRPPAASSAPHFPPRSTAWDDHREPDAAPSSPTVDMVSNAGRGSGIESGPQPSSEQPRNAAQSREALTRLNQIISNYHTKAALIILHSRVALPPSFSKGSESPRVNRWFNVELDDTDILREPLRPWRTCDATDNRPPPLIIETYIDTKSLTNNQSLVILDETGKRWDVRESLAALQSTHSKPYELENDEIVLERWRIELAEPSSRLPADLGSILPTVYKKSIVLFRSLVTYANFLPAWKFAKRNKQLRQSPALQIKYRVLDGSTLHDGPSLDHLTVPLSEGSDQVVETYNFGVTESPAGPFSVRVTYRRNCDFRVDDSEAILSSRFMGADDEIFRPSLPSEDVSRPNPEIGSVPVERRAVESPDRARAYGSLSTFHQVGPATGTSPISALRALRDSDATSPSPTDSSKKLLPPAKVVPSSKRAAQIAGEAGSFPRRPSISFQPFKAPPLSASPAVADSPLGLSPRTMSSRIPTGSSADSRFMPPPSSAASARRPISIPSEQAISSSNSASPKPAPLSRYSSSFSHRRGRLSTGGTRMEDEASSGRASATSSNAQPGSGLLAEATGTSAESIHADDENISDFLKMLDSKKDLMSSTSASVQAGPRQMNSTAVALARFRGMRDSNAALSDSMSQSMHLHRSSISSSKQLSGVPPMIGGTSVSTASSPGKPLSPHTPHTPHTPAIRSRLSSNSVADDPEADLRTRIPRIQHESPLEEQPNEAIRDPSSTAGAIDIPTSPRIFDPAYRRSSSAAVRRPIVTSGDDDEIFPFGLRSLSLGADEPSNVTLGVAQQRNASHKSQDSPADDPGGPSGSTTSQYRDSTSIRGQIPGPTGASASSHVYQPRFASSRGRGYSGHSVSSASSSLARGGNVPPHLTERDQDRDGNASGSNSGNSTMEIRRGSSHRPPTGRTLSAQAPEDDEPLLFAMSDFGASRRSLEEGRHGTHGGAESGSGSRRGSGRRGAGPGSFHIW